MTQPTEDGQYGYYEPHGAQGAPNRRLCEVQNGNVYFLDDNRVLKAQDMPGRFVPLLSLTPEVIATVKMALEHTKDDSRAIRLHTTWDEHAKIMADIDTALAWLIDETEAQRPAAVAQIEKREPTPDEIAYGLELERELKRGRCHQ